MSHCRTTLSQDICERTTPVIAFQIVDDAGVGFQPATLTLTLYVASTRESIQHRVTGPIINGRDKQNVFDQNDVTVDVSGNVVWSLTVDDTIVSQDAFATESHVALFEWTWNAGANAAKHEIEMVVKNLATVT